MKKPSESYEKLKDELFECRVELASWKKSFNILATCVTVIIAIITFFGYGKIEAVMKGVEARTEVRLSRVDELLAKVDTRQLDSITRLVSERTSQYEDAIAALDKGMMANRELLRLMIDNMPYNKKIESRIPSYIQKDAIGVMDVIFCDESLAQGISGNCYVLIDESFQLEEDDRLIIQVLPTGRRILVFDGCYVPQGKYNKLGFILNPFEKYKDYIVEVILLRKNGKDYYGYTLTRPLRLKDK